MTIHFLMLHCRFVSDRFFFSGLGCKFHIFLRLIFFLSSKGDGQTSCFGRTPAISSISSFFFGSPRFKVLSMEADWVFLSSIFHLLFCWTCSRVSRPICTHRTVVSSWPKSCGVALIVMPDFEHFILFDMLNHRFFFFCKIP